MSTLTNFKVTVICTHCGHAMHTFTIDEVDAFNRYHWFGTLWHNGPGFDLLQYQDEEAGKTTRIERVIEAEA